MIRRNLAVKVGLAIMGLIVAVAVVQYFALGQLLKNAFYDEAGAELTAEGQQYANMSAMGGTMMMQMLCVTASADLIMVDTKGNVVASSPALYLSKPNASDTATMEAALRGHNGLHGGFSGLFGKTGIVAAVPIRTQGQIQGAVLLFRSESAVAGAFRHVEWLLIMAGLGGILVALGLTVLLSKRIAKPLQLMSKVAGEMTRGNYTAEVPVVGEDEVGQLGEAIHTLAATLNHLDTSRKAFLADVAHELRTPMSYIRGYSQVLDEGLFESEEESKKYIRIIHKESKRLESLVNDLFVLAQADADMLQMDKRPVYLNEVISSVVDRMQKKAEDKGIQVSVVMMSPVPAIQADVARMEQVLVNLLDNAIRYTPSGGRIDIDLEKNGNSLQISVADTGVGIPKEDVTHIWERMYRVEKSRSRGSGGTGLGLSIVKQIVEAHGGNVGAKSQEGKGTTTFVTIPILTASGRR